MKPNFRRRAFTLVEMLLVIAIISVLAAMAISNFSNALVVEKLRRHWCW